VRTHLRCTSDHVLDEISVTRGVNDGVVLRRREEFLRSADDRHTFRFCGRKKSTHIAQKNKRETQQLPGQKLLTTFTFFLLTIHIEGESERRFAETIGLFAKLLHFTLRNAYASIFFVRTRR
jgi:hypothetical protein